MNRNVLFSVLAGLAFLFLQVITLSDYNIMWDARGHFTRGQSFANFFLHGKVSNEGATITKDFARYYRNYLGRNIESRDISKLVSQNPSYRKSIYQDQLKLGYFEGLIKKEIPGHPPLSDIGAAFSNMFFYEKLGIVRDDYAYGLFSVILASFLVGLFFYWIASSYGFFPAFISTIVIATTPLFWAEAHRNIKDVPLMVFFSLAIWAFWKGVTNQSKKWIFVSALFAGCALGTKFNALFLPIIIGPWLVFYFFKSSKSSRRIYLNWWWVFLIYPIIMFAVLFASWPQLWYDPIVNLLKVFGYYKDIGVNIDYTPAFRTIFGFNTYAPLWIFYTTYPIIIVLGLIGVIGCIARLKKTKDFLPFLFLLWLVVPILRVSLPSSAIYGGVRQIMEYIPALAFFAGYGAYIIISYILPRFKNILYFLIVLSFVPFVFTLIRLHPASNIYFNSLIGGLQGAKKANITSWGDTSGGIYEIAVKWLNKNAKKNSHIATAFSETADFYIPALRDDLLADNFFSGDLQKGEYIVGLIYDSELENTYAMSYLNTFLNPVYEFKADGVTLLKIWKNDPAYLKKEVASLVRLTVIPKVEISSSKAIWDLGNVYKITRLEFSYDTNNCKQLNSGYFQTSADNATWSYVQDAYPGGPINTLPAQPSGGNFIVPFALKNARYISLAVDPQDSCVLDVKSSKVTVLQ